MSTLSPCTHQPLTPRSIHAPRSHTVICRFWSKRPGTTVSCTGSFGRRRSHFSYSKWGHSTAPLEASARRRRCRQPGCTPSLQPALELPEPRSPLDRSIPAPPSGRGNSRWIATAQLHRSLQFSRGTFSLILCCPARAIRRGPGAVGGVRVTGKVHPDCSAQASSSSLDPPAASTRSAVCR